MTQQRIPFNESSRAGLIATVSPLARIYSQTVHGDDVVQDQAENPNAGSCTISLSLSV